MPRSETSSQRSAAASGPQSSRRIDCYVQDDVPAPFESTIERICRRLRELHETAVITDYTVNPWPSTDSDDSLAAADGQRTRADIVADFETWAAEHDRSLAPGFRRRSIASSFTSESPRDRLWVPIVALALYQDETLCGVVPSTEPASAITYTVPDCLETLETDGFETLHQTASTPPASRRRTEEGY
jgi:hypothetical protein